MRLHQMAAVCRAIGLADDYVGMHLRLSRAESNHPLAKGLQLVR